MSILLELFQHRSSIQYEKNSQFNVNPRELLHYFNKMTFDFTFENNDKEEEDVQTTRK